MPPDGHTPEATPASASATESRDAQFLQPLPSSKASSGLGPAPSQAAVSKWNTDSLTWRLGVDVASATSAAATICPIITVIDRAIIEKAARGVTIRQSLSSSIKFLVTRPHRFLASTPFLLIYTLYSCTYLTANFIDTSVSTLSNHAFSNTSAGPAKFAATAIVNMSLCVYKDSRFAKIFGPGSQSPSGTHAQSGATATASASTSSQRPANRPVSPPQSSAASKVPKTSLSLFCLRDSLTIFASFNLPQLLSPLIPDTLASTPSSKAALAQFSIPASVQIISTPLHLLGLDLYNRQGAGGIPAADRWARVKRDWAPSCAARVARIVPAFGLGGVVNTRLREQLMTTLDGQ